MNNKNDAHGTIMYTMYIQHDILSSEGNNAPEKEVKQMIKLTSNEKKVLAALIKSSEGNGHDFGFIEDARDAVGPKSLAGVVSSLVKKKILISHEPIKTDSGWWTQCVLLGVSDGTSGGSQETAQARLAELNEAINAPEPVKTPRAPKAKSVAGKGEVVPNVYRVTIYTGDEIMAIQVGEVATYAKSELDAVRRVIEHCKREGIQGAHYRAKPYVFGAAE